VPKRLIYTSIPLLILVLIVWRLFAIQAANRIQMEQRAAQLKAAPVVTVAVAQPMVISQVLESNSTIESPHVVNIASQITGRITFLDVHEGDPVKQGQILVRIDPGQAQAAVYQAQAALTEAQHRLVQAQLTQNPTIVSVSTQIQQGKAAVASAQADYSQASRNYQRLVDSAQAVLNDANSRVDSATASVSSAQSNLQNATIKYNRTHKLYEQGFVAAQDVDDALTAMEVQQSNLDSAKSQLNSATAQRHSADEQLSITKTTGKANIEDTQAKLTQAKSTLTLAISNRAQVPAYIQNIAALKSNVTQARANLQNAQSQLSYTVLASPLDGNVTARNMDPGAIATPGQSIISVQVLSTVWATIGIPEDMNELVNIGLPATLRLDAFPGTVFNGKVTERNSSADPQNRQIRVRVTLDNTNNKIKPGMYGRVSIVTNQQKTDTAVPFEAVHTDAKGPYVLVVSKDHKAERRKIVQGLSDANFTAINQGLKTGDQVVTLSVSPLRDGAKIKIGSVVPQAGQQDTGQHNRQGGGY